MPLWHAGSPPVCTVRVPMEGSPEGKRVFAPGGALAYIDAEGGWWAYSEDQLLDFMDSIPDSCYGLIHWVDIWPSCARRTVKNHRWTPPTPTSRRRERRELEGGERGRDSRAEEGSQATREDSQEGASKRGGHSTVSAPRK